MMGEDAVSSTDETMTRKRRGCYPAEPIHFGGIVRWLFYAIVMAMNGV
jgi:hypothetical protein